MADLTAAREARACKRCRERGGYSLAIASAQHRECPACLRRVLRAAGLNDLRRGCESLVAAIDLFLVALDGIMREPSTPERGQKIAALCNALDMSKDLVRQQALNVDLVAELRRERARARRGR